MNDGKSRDLPGQKRVKHCHYLVPLKFCETNACALGVCLQQRKAKRREWILHYFGSSEKQVCLPASAKMNTEKSANVLMRLPKQSVPIQEKMSFLVPDTPNWTHKQHQKEYRVGFFFLFFFLFVWLPVCLALSVDSQLSSPHGQNLNQAANQNSILLAYCSHHEHFNDALFICTFSVYSFISSPERFLFGSMLYISHVNRLCLYSETIACVRHLCKWQNRRWRGQIFSDPFNCGRTSCRLVGWCNKMILFAGWQLPHDAQMCSVCFTASLPRHSIQEPQAWGPWRHITLTLCTEIGFICGPELMAALVELHLIFMSVWTDKESWITWCINSYLKLINKIFITCAAEKEKK